MTGVVKSVRSCERSRPPTIAMPSGSPQLGADARAQRQRQRAEERGQRGHQDGPEAQHGRP